VITVKHFFVFSTVLCGGLLLSPVASAREAPTAETEQVIKPEVDRRSMTVPHLNARDYEISAYTGFLTIDGFGTSGVYGGRFAYHVVEDLFLEATYASSTVSDGFYRTQGIAIFPQEQTELTYYHLSAGINIFPGEFFFGRSNARSSYIYLLGGVGNTTFDLIDSTTFNFGFGMRVMPYDWLAVRVEMRDHVFESDLLGEKKYTHNTEFTLGLSFIF